MVDDKNNYNKDGRDENYEEVSNNYNEDEQDEDYEEVSDTSDSFARNGRRKKIIVIIGILLVGGLSYNFLFNGSDDSNTESKKEKNLRIDNLIKNAKKPTQDVTPRVIPQNQENRDKFSISTESIELPSLPSVNILESHSLPDDATPPIAQNMPTLGNRGQQNFQEIPRPQEQGGLFTRKKHHTSTPQEAGSMLAISGGSVTQGKDKDKDKNLTVDLSVVPDSAHEKQTASRMTDLRATVAQGKLISLVLETAISSDLKGTLRGVITSDVYSELGKNVLIPKGSRLLGKYSFSGSFGSSRLNITWNRIILPNGFDLTLSALGVDSMGRSGVSGIVDDKFGNVLTSTVLLAGVSIGAAATIAKIPGLDSKITKSSDTSKPETTTTTSSTSSQIVSDSINEASDALKGLIKRYANEKPTIYVDQGTAMKAFPSADLVFPWETIGGYINTIR